MPTFSNVHSELDNHEIHPPRDFSLADNDTFLAKNPLGDIEWFDTYWQRPILGFANAALPPLTVQHGDRYILFGSSSVGSTAIDTSMGFSIDTSIDTSMDSSGLEPTDGVHPMWGEVAIGEIAEYYRSNNKDQPIFEWRTVAPKSGYQVFNLADRETYYYSGSAWIKKVATTATPALAQFENTYAALALLASEAKLKPGCRYLITDRGIILTATSASSFGIEGDHTRPLSAHGCVQLLSGSSGSINSIMVNSTELLTAPLVYDTSLLETALLLTDAINAGTTVHGFNSVNIGASVYIGDAINRGSILNGATISASAVGITTSAQPLARGANAGNRWFKVKYRFAEDWIAEMADGQGNVVSCESQVVDTLGINSCNVFPWAYATVTNNVVKNAILVTFPADGIVDGNHIIGNSWLFANVRGGGVLRNNTIKEGAQLMVHLDGTSYFAGNTFLKSNWQSQTNNATVFGNHVVLSTIRGINTIGGYWAINEFYGSTLTLDNSSLNLYHNHLEQVELAATGATATFSRNKAMYCNIDITGVASGYSFQQNQIATGATINLQGAVGSFDNNTIGDCTIEGTDSETSFRDNKILEYSSLNLVDYMGAEFWGNDIKSSTLSLEDATGNFNHNEIASSSVTMEQHTGNCTQNVFINATVTSNDSASLINNNYIHFSTLKLSNTNGEFSSNKATYYSTYDLDGYLGDRILLCEVMKSSQLICSGNTQEQGRIILDEITTLDISDEDCILYQSNFRYPSATIKLASSQINAVCTNEKSSIVHFVTLEVDGTLDLSIIERKYGGIYCITNVGTLTSITGVSTLPKEFIVKVVSSGSITIDTTAANILIANGITIGTLIGSANHYVKISQQNGFLVIIEAYTS